MIMDDSTLKTILEKEIDFHSKEAKEHSRLARIRNSKTQNKKCVKHMHKQHQTIKIAEKLGFIFCKCCGGLRKR